MVKTKSKTATFCVDERENRESSAVFRTRFTQLHTRFSQHQAIRSTLTQRVWDRQTTNHQTDSYVYSRAGSCGAL